MGKETIVVKVDMLLVARAIAKTAHCTAGAEYGIDGFEPFLANLILGRDGRSSHFVGCVEKRFDREEATHWCKLHPYDHSLEGRIVVGRLRLFANLGAPVFHCAVGKLPSNQTIWNRSQGWSCNSQPKTKSPPRIIQGGLFISALSQPQPFGLVRFSGIDMPGQSVGAPPF